MKQLWVLEGRAWDSEWHPLKHNRRKTNLQLNKVQKNARRLGLKAEYRVLLVDVNTTPY